MRRIGLGVLFRDRHAGLRTGGTRRAGRRPAGSPLSSSARFWDRAADGYARKAVADPETYQHELEATRRYLRPDMQVLEFGCGTGSTALEHAPRVARYLATDVSPKMIDIARSKLAATGIDNLRFEAVPFESLEARWGTYDAVLGLNILHLLGDPDAAIRRIHDLLKPGGLFVGSTVCLADGVSWLRPVLWMAGRLGLAPRVGILSRQALKRSLAEAGFRIDYDYELVPKKGDSGCFIIAIRSPEAECRT